MLERKGRALKQMQKCKLLQTVLQKRVASYGMSWRPNFLHLKSNLLGAKTSMQERKGGRGEVHKAGLRKCVLMLMSFCRSYVNSSLLTAVFLAPLC